MKLLLILFFTVKQISFNFLHNKKMGIQKNMS